MPKKSEKKSALSILGWIDGLPEGGGTWGKGITETVTAFEVEAEAADKEIEGLDAQVKALREKAAQRRAMALQTARRAEREAVKLYTADQLKSAGYPAKEPAQG